MTSNIRTIVGSAEFTALVRDDLSLAGFAAQPESLRAHKVFQHELHSLRGTCEGGQLHRVWIKQFVGEYSAWTHEAAENLLQREAAAMALANQVCGAGVRVPKFAVFQPAGQGAAWLVTGHVEGRSLRTLAAPENLNMAADMLAALARAGVQNDQTFAVLPRISLPQFIDNMVALAARTGDELLQSCLHRAGAIAARVGPAPACLVHGDCHGGNWLTDGQRITAMLDWEDAIIGDPRFDLGQMMRDLKAWDRDDRIDGFVSRYSERSGIEISAPEDWIFLVNLRDYAAMVALRHLMIHGAAPLRTNLKSWLDFGDDAAQSLADDD